MSHYEDEAARYKRLYEEEYTIVARCWEALGISSYVGANGKSIYELIADLKAKADSPTEADDEAWRMADLLHKELNTGGSGSETPYSIAERAVLAYKRLERDATIDSDAAKAWWKAACPYATPGALREALQGLDRDAARFTFLQNISVVQAQAFFWTYQSRKQRAEAIDAAMRQSAPQQRPTGDEQP